MIPLLEEGKVQDVRYNLALLDCVRIEVIVEISLF